MPTDHEKSDEGTRISNLMKAYTKPALAAVYGVVSEEFGVLIGSGTFLRLCGNSYLLTAEHVVDEGRKYATIAHTTSSGKKPAQFKYWFRIAKPPIDLALARIDEEVIKEHGIQPWGVEAMGDSSADIERDVLFLHGYPGDQSKWLPIVEGGIHSTSMPFWASDGVSDWDEFDPDKHFAIVYPRDGWFDEKKRPIPMPLPDGLSGSAVWQTNRRDSTGAEWTPDHSRIVGLVHLWNKKPESLVATRIEVLRTFLLDALRHEKADALWEARGRPLWDNLHDWCEAERLIPDLW